ncbi:MAG: SBBP repeat-containing protein [Anaerolineales bacterium]|nr:SBBP repeat-containing protein [Anaerolineales bacterium]MDW8162308.1 SBBP repeat-containing protein [Anaerolineales bacterium]
MEGSRLFKWLSAIVLIALASVCFSTPRPLLRGRVQSVAFLTAKPLSFSHIPSSSSFLPNLGQYPPEVLFVAQQGNLTLWFMQDAVWFSLAYRDSQSAGHGERPGKFPPPEAQSRVLSWKLSFVEENPQAVLVAEVPLSPRFNFFRGVDPNHWVTNVIPYSHLIYRELYPGLDLRIEFGDQGLQWAFSENGEGREDTLGKPHLRIEGLEAVQIESNRLVFQTPIGMFELPLPSTKHGLKVSWQTPDGEQKQTEIPSVDEKIGLDATGLRIASFGNNPKGHSFSSIAFAQDNPSEVVFSTYLGGSGEETAFDVAVDGEGYVYVVGSTSSLDFPGVSGGFDPQHNGGQDVFVSKLSPDASDLLYSTYIGGNNVDRGYAIEISQSGEAIIGGVTTSSNFPYTLGSVGGNGDGFVLRLSAQGNQLQFSRLMGGSQFDAVYDLVIDDSGRIYLTGETSSDDFPIAYGHLGGKDCFVGKLRSTRDAFQSVGLLSGSGDDVCYAIDLYEGEKVAVAGSTSSQNFPLTQGAFSTQFSGGDADGFIAYLDLSQYEASRTYSSYLGGNGWDEVLALDYQGGFSFLTGFTSSTNFPLASAYDSIFSGVYDAFVIKFHPTFGLAFGTYLGGGALDIGRAIAVTNSGEALVAGNTSSNNFPTTSSALFQTAQGGEDVFLAKLSLLGDSLLYSTFFGASGSERGYGIALGRDPRPYIVGYTDSDSLLLSDSAVDQIFQVQEAFVLKLALGYFPTPTPSKSPSPLPSLTATPLPTSTRTPLPTKTVTPTRTPSPTPTSTPTRTPTQTRTLTPTRTERPTMTMVPTSTTKPTRREHQIYLPWINAGQGAP